MKILNAKILSLLLPGLLTIAAMPAHALRIPPNISFNESGQTCVLNAAGQGDCVIPGTLIGGTAPVPNPIAADLPQLLSVTTNTPLVTVLSKTCGFPTFNALGGSPTYYQVNNVACDIVVFVKPGAVVGGSLEGELTYSYSWVGSFDFATGAPGPRITTTIDPPLSSYLTVSLGDPASQGSSLLYGSNGVAVGNSATADPALHGALGLSSSPSSGGSSVPAPGVAGLFGLALAGLTFTRRRKV